MQLSFQPIITPPAPQTRSASPPSQPAFGDIRITPNGENPTQLLSKIVDSFVRNLSSFDETQSFPHTVKNKTATITVKTTQNPPDHLQQTLCDQYKDYEFTKGWQFTNFNTPST